MRLGERVSFHKSAGDCLVEMYVGTVVTKNGKRILAGDVASRFLAPMVATGLYNGGDMVGKRTLSCVD